jgi:putative Holliday junction resolvase
MAELKQLLGLDVGLKRIGIARASDNARLAEPLLTVSTPEAIKTLRSLIEEYNINIVVVGLPRNLRGDDTAQTTWVRDWIKHAKSKIDLPFYWQDEALTSRIAEAKRQVHKHPHDIDSLAAAIILQDFLDSTESERNIV